MHEGIPILDFRCPRLSPTRRAGSRACCSRRSPLCDAEGRRQLVPTGEPDELIPCDDVLVAIGQENAFPDRARSRPRVRSLGPRVVHKVTMQSTLPNVFLGAMRPLDQRTSSGRSHMATRRPSRLTSSAGASPSSTVRLHT